MNVLIRAKDPSDQHLFFAHQIRADQYAAAARNDRRRENARTPTAGHRRALLAAPEA